MRFDGFQYGSRIDLVPSETPERRRLTQNQQTPQERCETRQSKKIGGKHPGGPNYLQPEVHAAPSY